MKVCGRTHQSREVCRAAELERYPRCKTRMSIALSTGQREATHCFFFFQAEDGIRDYKVTGVQTCALPILTYSPCSISAMAEIERGEYVTLDPEILALVAETLQRAAGGWREAGDRRGSCERDRKSVV